MRGRGRGGGGGGGGRKGKSEEEGKRGVLGVAYIMGLGNYQQ